MRIPRGATFSVSRADLTRRTEGCPAEIPGVLARGSEHPCVRFARIRRASILGRRYLTDSASGNSIGTAQLKTMAPAPPRNMKVLSTSPAPA